MEKSEPAVEAFLQIKGDTKNRIFIFILLLYKQDKPEWTVRF